MDAALAIFVTILDIDGDLREPLAPVDQPKTEEPVQAFGQVVCFKVCHV